MQRRAMERCERIIGPWAVRAEIGRAVRDPCPPALEVRLTARIEPPPVVRGTAQHRGYPVPSNAFRAAR